MVEWKEQYSQYDYLKWKKEFWNSQQQMSVACLKYSTKIGHLNKI